MHVLQQLYFDFLPCDLSFRYQNVHVPFKITPCFVYYKFLIFLLNLCFVIQSFTFIINWFDDDCLIECLITIEIYTISAYPSEHKIEMIILWWLITGRVVFLPKSQLTLKGNSLNHGCIYMYFTLIYDIMFIAMNLHCYCSDIVLYYFLNPSA